MNKYISFIVAVGAVATVGCPVVFAEDEAVAAPAAVSVTTVVKPSPLKARVEAIKAKTDARVEAIKERTENRVDAVKERAENRTEKLEARAELRVELTAEQKAKALARGQKIKAERKEKLDSAKKSRVEAAARNSVRVLTEALARVEELAVRVETRAQKIDSTGTSVADALTKLSEGKALWDTAKSQVDALEADLKLALDSETPMGTFETFRTHAASAKEGIKAAHAKIVEAIVALKVVTKNATSTPDVNASTQVSQ